MAAEGRDGGRTEGTDFIRAIVAKHREEGTYGGRVETRFPPEPNGYLHIGHSKAIVLNFGLAQENGGVCHLRFDDTNPLTEDMKYVRSIQEDVRWLGFEWGDHLYFASDYFERLHECALVLVGKGKAYVDSLSEEEIRDYRGTVTEPGRDSPYRNRSVEENLDLFRRMKEGEFANGEHVLRAKIDMAHSNMVMRDPVLYRIRHASHYRSGDAWCIYPLYDFTHCLSDAFEDITHSLCTLEFENNREIYDWLLDEVGFEEPRTHQYEFARLNLDYTVVSKRKLLRLVNEGHVEGWDDPRMPTIAGMRRRGLTPEAIRNFAGMVGVAKAENRVDLGKLEFAIRDHLNLTVPRVMGVLDPLKVVIRNYPEGQGAMKGDGGGLGDGAADGVWEELEAPSYPHDVPLEGSRMVPFSRELYIEKKDFREDPPKDFFGLAPGREVRLRYGYFIRCEEVLKDPETGELTEIHCTYDPATRGGDAPDGRKVKGTLHWVSAAHALPVEVRLYDRLFSVPNPEAVYGKDFTECLNPESKVVLNPAYVEPSVAADPPGTRYQFERQGYFMTDEVDSKEGAMVFNRIVTLRDTWGRRAEGKGIAEQVTAVTSGGPKGEPNGTQLRLSQGQTRETAEGSPGEPASPKRDRRNVAKEAREAARVRDPELTARHERYQKDLGLPEEDADILAGSMELSDFFEAAMTATPGMAAGAAEPGAGAASGSGRADVASPVSLANWIVNDLLREVKDRPLSAIPVTPEGLADLVALLEGGVISQPVAKEIFTEMVTRGVDPGEFVRENSLEKVGDVSELKPIVDRVIGDNPAKAEEYRNGKIGLLGFFMGQIMRETNGKADPEVVQKLILEVLGE